MELNLSREVNFQYTFTGNNNQDKNNDFKKVQVI